MDRARRRQPMRVAVVDQASAQRGSIRDQVRHDRLWSIDTRPEQMQLNFDADDRRPGLDGTRGAQR